MRQLESLDVYRVSHDLAAAAYMLTLEPRLAPHFALIDQIRRASISVPANIAEGYALATRPQFIRHLRIALGSCAELVSHLKILKRLSLVPEPAVCDAQELGVRTISMLVALLRNLCRNGRSRFSFPASRFTTGRRSPESSS